MSDTITHYFTFGTAQTADFPLPEGGKLGDYWVEVTLPANSHLTHRGVFIKEFTSRYCESENQFAFEHTADTFNPDFFERGRLTDITVSTGGTAPTTRNPDDFGMGFTEGGETP